MILKKRIGVPAVLFCTCLLFISFFAFANPPLSPRKWYAVKKVADTIPENDSANKIFAKVEIEASYTGGDKAWLSFLSQNINAGVPTKKRRRLELLQ